MSAKKTQLLMFMIVSLVSGGMAILMAIALGSRDFLTISIPGFVVGGFFAFKYFTFDRKKAREEEHRRKRSRH